MKRKIPFKMTFFSGAVLILLLLVFFFGRHFAQKELFNSKNTTTLYAETKLGEEPKIDFKVYFRDQDYDFGEFTYDLRGCDLNTPGVYQIPVYYKGELTTCVLKLRVGEEEGQEQKGQEEEKAVGSELRPAR